MKISQSHTFTIALTELLKDDPNLKEIVQETIILFLNNPSDTRLNIHPLLRSLKDKYALNVTGDIRIILPTSVSIM